MVNRTTKIVMVCLGNICRSPLAEGILKNKLDSDNYLVDSAGTANYHTGKSPDKRSIAVARKNGLDITNQKAAHFQPSYFKQYDLIFVMDLNNYNDVLSLAKNKQDRDKVSLILNETYPNQNMEVPDPYYGGLEGFDYVYELLDAACEVIANRL